MECPNCGGAIVLPKAEDAALLLEAQNLMRAHQTLRVCAFCGEQECECLTPLADAIAAAMKETQHDA